MKVIDDIVKELQLKYKFDNDVAKNIRTIISSKLTEYEITRKTNKKIVPDGIYKRIIDYLNSKADTKYKHTSKSTQSLIKARLNEGFTEEDFKRVIDKKLLHWSNTEFSIYIRPTTLFSTKFESYLNQKEGGSQNRKRSYKQSCTTSEEFKIPTTTMPELTDEERRRAEDLF